MINLKKEYIERGEVIANSREYNLGGSYDNIERAVPVDTINSIPAADVVLVVRCRDCEHKGWVQEPEHGKSVDYCRLLERCVDKQFFCAAGERKTNFGGNTNA